MITIDVDNSRNEQETICTTERLKRRAREHKGQSESKWIIIIKQIIQTVVHKNQIGMKVASTSSSSSSNRVNMQMYKINTDTRSRTQKTSFGWTPRSWQRWCGARYFIYWSTIWSISCSLPRNARHELHFTEINVAVHLLTIKITLVYNIIIVYYIIINLTVITSKNLMISFFLLMIENRLHILRVFITCTSVSVIIRTRKMCVCVFHVSIFVLNNNKNGRKKETKYRNEIKFVCKLIIIWLCHCNTYFSFPGY